MYRIEFEDRVQYLHILIQGTESYAAAVQFWVDLSDKCQREQIKKVLIVDMVQGSLDTLETYKIAGRFSGVKIAFVDQKPETFRNNQFGETVIHNRAGQVKLFDDPQIAEAWLKAS